MVHTGKMETARNNLAEVLRAARHSWWLAGLGYLAAGFLLSAAALGRQFQPLALGLACAAPGGWRSVLLALGGGIGYPFFWGRTGLEGTVWMALGMTASLFFGNQGIVKRQKALLPALAALIVSGTGVVFLYRFQQDTPIPVYLLRVVVGAGATAVFSLCRTEGRQWETLAVLFLAELALAQVVPVRYLGLGFVLAGYLASAGDFPSAVGAGLALDLAQVTGVKMTAVLCAAWCVSRIPRAPKWFPVLAAALAYVPVAVLSGSWDVRPLPGLILGGAVAGLLPGLGIPSKPAHRSGETAVAQVRLEQMALALHQMEQTLLVSEPPAPDRQAVLSRSCAMACDTCPERRGCKTRNLLAGLDPSLLEQPGLSEEDVPPGCKKQTRLITELRRGQEQLRRIKGDGNRAMAYRQACQDQFGFLAEFLEGLSDDLARRNAYKEPKFHPEIGMSTRSREEINGDKCIWFEGIGNRFYVLLCDGMGTGEEAARESEDAAKLVKQMLLAGLPAEYALRSMNALAVLRQMGGCATVDLAELRLDTGKGTVYNWGAAPSYVMSAGQLKKIGTAGPPPGLANTARETVDRLSLGRGELLILLSDGVSEGGLLDSARTTPMQPPGEMAAAILEKKSSGGDDATAVVIKLTPGRLSAS